MRTTHTQEICAPVTAANRRDWTNPNRIRCPKVGGGSFGHLMRRLECPTNFAPPEESFAPPPGRNSVNFAPPPRVNSEPGNDLRERAGAKLAEFRPTRKRKKFCWGEIHEPGPKPLLVSSKHMSDAIHARYQYHFKTPNSTRSACRLDGPRAIAAISLRPVRAIRRWPHAAFESDTFFAPACGHEDIRSRPAADRSMS